MPPITHKFLEDMRGLFLQHAPASYAKTLQPGARYKFAKVHHVPTDEELAAHLAGTSTIAVPLIGAGDLAYHAAADIDAGGEATLRHGIEEATRQGFICFGFTSRTYAHDGGHLWMFFDALTHPVRLRTAMRGILTAAQADTKEVHPLHQSLRLPFGRHTWTGRRGQLLLPSGSKIDLDAGTCTIRAAVKHLAHTPRNTVRSLPMIDSTPAVNQSRFVRGGSYIAAYNQSTNILALLEHYGGRIAERQYNRVLMHCPCGNHMHGDARPSLWLRPATRPDIHGDWIALGLTPSCRFYTERGRVINAFNVFCIMENLTSTEAVEQIREQEVR